jgi:hypothetical protein
VRCGIRQERHEPGILERNRQTTLVLGACARLSARLDLASIRKVTAKALNVLIIDLTNMIDTE